MNILLIQPPPRKIGHEDVVVPPLGIAYIAAFLERQGYAVKITDGFALQMDWQDFEREVARAKPDIIGITGMSAVIDNTFRAVGICRKYAKYIILGGAHVSAYREKVFDQCQGIDFLVYGEGEYTFLELVKKLERGEDSLTIRGLISKGAINPPREQLKNLDELPFPSRHLLPNARYRYTLFPGRRVTTMFTSRGCPYECKFCDTSVFGHKYRARSANNVLNEIKEIVEQHGINSIIIYDDLFMSGKDRIENICEGIIEMGLKIEWKCEGRPDKVEGRTLRLMKEAGCSMIAYGVESGNQKALNYLKKKTTIEGIRETFRLTKKLGIKPIGYFILGIPAESYEEAMNTIRFAKEIDPTYAQFSILTPFYGTEIYKEAKEKGWYREIDAQNPVDKDLKRAVMVSPNWSEDKLKKIIKVAHRKFYCRLGYLLRRLKEIRNTKEFISQLATAANILRWYLKGV
jgi:radical SAM superfamily enzyme YgiQ (UPF0313 family)